MQKLGTILPQEKDWELMSDVSEEEKVQFIIDCENRKPGELHLDDGYNCTKCLNRGYFLKMEHRVFKAGDDPRPYDVQSSCDCMKIRNSIKRMKRSGLEPVLKRSTFDKYETPEAWQQFIKDAAIRFANDADSLEHKWFFIGGGVGSGKTHLCTAIAREFLLQGKEVRYMLWVKQSQEMKAAVNDESYGKALAELQNVDVLYIDDFFKPMKDGFGNETKPTAADIRLAYEIINHRYQNHDLITIISSERHIGEIEEIDSAVGSRIYEMTETHSYNIEKSKKRNYRLISRDVI